MFYFSHGFAQVAPSHGVILWFERMLIFVEMFDFKPHWPSLHIIQLFHKIDSLPRNGSTCNLSLSPPM